jgi:hypothetical protein
MYLGILESSEQEQIVRALKGPQFEREQHGSLYDRGSADSYYGRMPDPHWWPNGTGHGVPVSQLKPEEIEEYLAGYAWNEQYGHKKSYD